MADTYGEMMARINADLINSKNSGIDTNALNNINRENRDIIISISNTLNSYYREQSKFSKIISIFVNCYDFLEFNYSIHYSIIYYS
ncbi:hypothetical protein KS04_18505 [Elizabethkingia miricola]|nr:hypothetical protein KS04_18505 [Elizabethkingia miricola]